MSFIETRFLDNFIALGSSGGPRYNTEVTELSSGLEQRNQAWAYPRHRYLLGISAGESSKIEDLRQLHHSTRGRFNGFRFKDFNDFTSAANIDGTPAFDDQSMGFGDGTSLSYQLLKNYAAAAGTVTRKITKPIAALFLLGYKGTGWTVQDIGDRWSLDATTGIVTFLADISKSITGATDQGGGVTRITSVAHGVLATAGTIHLSTFTGDWAGMNDRRYAIVARSTDWIDVTWNSSGYTAYSSNAGQINTIPQTTEELMWGGEFDVPVRFANDEIQVEKVSPGIERATVELLEIK
jgi:uncharacterized protein (TIGR02217 family)